MNYAILGWFIALAVFAVAEGATVALVSIWFSVGALAALFTSIFTENFYLQFIVFFVVSGILLLATRPFCKKYLNNKKVRTNADMVIGERGTVIDPIDNIQGNGRIKVSGQTWAARSESGEPIGEGATVEVVRMESVKLFVKEINT